MCPNMLKKYVENTQGVPIFFHMTVYVYVSFYVRSSSLSVICMQPACVCACAGLVLQKKAFSSLCDATDVSWV